VAGLASKKHYHFEDGKVGISHSSQFLNNYLSSLSNIKEGILHVDVEGKRPIFELKEIQSVSPSPAKGSQWKPPDTNWLCLSIDASYIKETNVAPGTRSSVTIMDKSNALPGV
jgi:hypothetical protein